jgi:hypothetical protein
MRQPNLEYRLVTVFLLTDLDRKRQESVIMPPEGPNWDFHSFHATPIPPGQCMSAGIAVTSLWTRKNMQPTPEQLKPPWTDLK